MKKQLNNTRGETIVEIVVSFLLLMIFTAVFATALRYAQNTMLKAEQLREANYQLCGVVYPLDEAMNRGNKTGSATYSFDAQGFGTFTVEDVALYELEASYTDPATNATSEHSFRSYGKEVAP